VLAHVFRHDGARFIVTGQRTNGHSVSPHFAGQYAPPIDGVGKRPTAPHDRKAAGTDLLGAWHPAHQLRAPSLHCPRGGTGQSTPGTIGDSDVGVQGSDSHSSALGDCSPQRAQAGLALPAGPTTPYVELQLLKYGTVESQLAAGIRLALGGRDD
jgi:hypothetical protein